MEGLPGDPASGVDRAPSGSRSALTRRLVLWRHGRTEWNATGRIQGQLDPPLDAVGVEQAAAASAVLATLSPAAIVSSDLQRAAMTAAVLADLTGLSPRHDERLREIHLGSWEGLTRDEVAEKFPGEWAGWMAGDDVRRGGGETYTEVGDRGSASVLDALDATDGLVVAVTHGGTARSTIGVLLELDPRSWWRLGPLGNCRWSVLVDGGQGWRLIEHNAGVPEVAVAVEERAGDDAR